MGKAYAPAIRKGWYHVDESRRDWNAGRPQRCIFVITTELLQRSSSIARSIAYRSCLTARARAAMDTRESPALAGAELTMVVGVGAAVGAWVSMEAATVMEG